MRIPIAIRRCLLSEKRPGWVNQWISQCQSMSQSVSKSEDVWFLNPSWCDYLGNITPNISTSNTKPSYQPKCREVSRDLFDYFEWYHQVTESLLESMSWNLGVNKSNAVVSTVSADQADGPRHPIDDYIDTDIDTETDANTDTNTDIDEDIDVDVEAGIIIDKDMDFRTQKVYHRHRRRRRHTHTHTHTHTYIYIYIMYGLPWIKTFLVTSETIRHEWLSHEWNSLANPSTSDQNRYSR